MPSNLHEGASQVLRDQVRKMTSQAVNWANEITDLAGPFLPTDTKESWLSRAHRRVQRVNDKVSFKMVERLFYGRVADPKFSVASSVLSAAEQARIEAARREAAQLAQRFETIAGGLNAKDSDFYSAHVSALIDAADKLRDLDRTGD
jgi:hypothetical protein